MAQPGAKASPASSSPASLTPARAADRITPDMPAGAGAVVPSVAGSRGEWPGILGRRRLRARHSGNPMRNERRADMKVGAFNGSPRKSGNTAMLLHAVLEELRKEGIETELVQLGGRKIRGCTACMKCFENRDRHCSVTGDILNGLGDRMVEADGIVIGSPT